MIKDILMDLLSSYHYMALSAHICIPASGMNMNQELMRASREGCLELLLLALSDNALMESKDTEVFAPLHLAAGMVTLNVSRHLLRGVLSSIQKILMV